VAFSTEIYYKFTAESACKIILRSVNSWLSYGQESWLPHAFNVSEYCPAERWRTSPDIYRFYDDALYKSTFYLLAYLLMARNSCC